MLQHKYPSWLCQNPLQSNVPLLSARTDIWPQGLYTQLALLTLYQCLCVCFPCTSTEVMDEKMVWNAQIKRWKDLLVPAVCWNRTVLPETRQDSSQTVFARQDFEPYLCVLLAVCLPGSLILDPMASRFHVSALKQILGKLGLTFFSHILNLFFFWMRMQASFEMAKL